jgi:rhamnosyltransferase
MYERFHSRKSMPPFQDTVTPPSAAVRFARAWNLCQYLCHFNNAPAQLGMDVRMRLNAESPEPRLHANAVCAVLVTYHPDPALPARLRRVAPQVGAIVIVDNGSADTELRMLRELAADPRIHLILNRENLGVARALNLGVQRAASLGYSLALLLDQDTGAEADMVQTLLDIYASFTPRHRLAVIGSNYKDANRPSQNSNDEAGMGTLWDEAESVITSGSLLPLAAHADIGPFREEFFIDFVDTDYCFRARAKGYYVIKSRKSLMSHAIGALRESRFLWFRRWTYNHSPDRRYYFARNNTVLIREYAKHGRVRWMLKSLNRCFRLCKRVVLYEKTRTRKIAAIAAGWRDGVMGKMGPRHAAKRTGA